MLLNDSRRFIHRFVLRYMIEQLVGLEQPRLIRVDALGMGTMLATQHKKNVRSEWKKHLKPFVEIVSSFARSPVQCRPRADSVRWV